jgi:tRNA (mo5U34)-methyltransferase
LQEKSLADQLVTQNVAAEFETLVRRFRENCARLGLGDVSKYCWYHTIDLGEGLITPGSHDYRPVLPNFGFPHDMHGMSVLDVGSATGFFAFEFEKRGAHVVSVELTSLEDLDRFPGQTTDLLLRKIEHMISPDGSGPQYTKDELYFYLLDGAFRFCHKQLKSSVRRCYSTIYDLSSEKLGRDAFDVVFLGDILVHTLYPLKALAAVSPLCRGTLILSQIMPEELGSIPAMLYVGGEKPAEDDVSWWWPNKACFVQMLAKLGFREVEEVGRNQGVLRPSGHPFDRPILHARR